VKVLIALLPAVVLILGAGVAYASDNDAPDTSTSGGQGGKVAGQGDPEEPGDTEDDDGSRETEVKDGPSDADEPGDVDGPGDTGGTREPTCEPTTEPTTEPTCAPTIADEPVSYKSSPALLAPGAALLVGSGVITYAILRRRQ
jgi:hypothetical protein